MPLIDAANGPLGGKQLPTAISKNLIFHYFLPQLFLFSPKYLKVNKCDTK